MAVQTTLIFILKTTPSSTPIHYKFNKNWIVLQTKSNLFGQKL